MSAITIEWHGWARRNSDHGALHVGYLPGRKSPCLYVARGARVNVLAFFRNEEAAKTALAWLDNFAGEDAPVHTSVINDGAA